MNFRDRRVLFFFGLGIALSAAPFSYSQPIEDIVVSTGHAPPWTRWDTGVMGLSVINSKGETQPLTMRFSGKAFERLDSLIISASDWTLDLTEYVVQLTSPVPSRIGVAFFRDEGVDINYIRVRIPYFAEIKTGQRVQCSVLVAEFEKGQSSAVMKTNEIATFETCVP